MQIEEASTNNLDAAYAVLVACREALEAQGLLQWDPQYPSRAFFRDAVADRTLFAMSDGGHICGVVILNESQPPEWSVAAWRNIKHPFLVIHAFAISPQLQGRGYGRQLLRFCEDLARARNYVSIRLDAFSENSTALHFYEQHGYAFRGDVQFASKPIGHQRYCCYEKFLALNEQSIQPNNSIQRTRCARR